MFRLKMRLLPAVKAKTMPGALATMAERPAAVPPPRIVATAMATVARTATPHAPCELPISETFACTTDISSTTVADVAPPQLRVGAGLPILNNAIFEQTAGFLDIDLTRSHMQTLAERGNSLLSSLSTPDSVARDGEALAQAAHMLAGSAGMFGFERLSTVARCFERAMHREDHELALLAIEVAETVALTNAAIEGMRAAGLTPVLTAAKI